MPEVYKTAGLFGLWSDGHTSNVEIIRSNNELRIERPFGSKTHTLTIQEARQLAETILTLCKD